MDKAILSTNHAETYCKKEFLTDSPEPSTSSVVSFSGLIQWGSNDKPEPVNFLEISNCHEKARLHRTFEMTSGEWISQLQRLQGHIGDYVDYLKSKEGKQ